MAADRATTASHVGQSGAGWIVGLEQPEILGAEPDEDVLGGVHDIVLAQPDEERVRGAPWR